MNICSINVTITNARNVREYCIIYSLQNIEMDTLFLLENGKNFNYYFIWIGGRK
jgi:hypothetical protein